jgi:hypothetical protein
MPAKALRQWLVVRWRTYALRHPNVEMVRRPARYKPLLTHTRGSVGDTAPAIRGGSLLGCCPIRLDLRAVLSQTVRLSASGGLLAASGAGELHAADQPNHEENDQHKAKCPS